MTYIVYCVCSYIHAIYVSLKVYICTSNDFSTPTQSEFCDRYNVVWGLPLYITTYVIYASTFTCTTDNYHSLMCRVGTRKWSSPCLRVAYVYWALVYVVDVYYVSIIYTLFAYIYKLYNSKCCTYTSRQKLLYVSTKLIN